MLAAWFAFATLQREPLLPLLKAGDEARIAEAVRSDPSGYLPQALDALKGEDPLVRSRAAVALRHLDLAARWPGEIVARKWDKEGLSEERKRITAALLKAAKDPVMKVRNESIRSLVVVLRNRTWGSHGEAWSDPKRLQPLIDLGPSIYPPILTILRSNDGKAYPLEVKIAALRILDSFQSVAILNEALRLMDGEDVYLATYAMLLTEKYDDPRIVPSLLANHGKGLGGYGSAAAEVIMGMKERAIPYLQHAARYSRDAQTRYRAIVHLSNSRDPESLPVLKWAAEKDQEAWIRERAKAALESYAYPADPRYYLPD